MEINALKGFMEMSSNGNLILDSNLNVIYANKKLASLFDDETDHAFQQFGSLFRCENALHESNGCGRQSTCRNCPVRSSALTSLSENRVVDNVQVIRTFVGAIKKKTRWFNMAFTPIELDGAKHVWVSMTDLSEMMNYRVEKYLTQPILEDEILFDKGQFHENTICAIERQISSGASFGLFLISCEVEERERGTFDKLWLNKQLEAYHHVLVENTTKNERVCRYDSSRYLLFTVAETHDAVNTRLAALKQTLEVFEGHISLSNNKLFSYRALVIVPTANTVEFESEALDIEYFKWLSTLESQADDQFITIEI